MTEPADYARLAPAVTALGDQLETLLADLAALLDRKEQLWAAISDVLGDDADLEETARAAAETGCHRVTGLCLDAHALLRLWCLPDR